MTADLGISASVLLFMELLDVVLVMASSIISSILFYGRDSSNLCD